MDIDRLRKELKHPEIINAQRQAAFYAGIEEALKAQGMTRSTTNLPDIAMPNESGENAILAASVKAGMKAGLESSTPSSGFNIALGTPRLTPQGITIPSTADDWTSSNCTRSSEKNKLSSDQNCTRYITNQNFKGITDDLTRLGVSYTAENGATFSLTGSPKAPTASVKYTKRF